MGGFFCVGNLNLSDGFTNESALNLSQGEVVRSTRTHQDYQTSG